MSTDANVISSSSSRPSSAATNQACAACKYQRRKCNPDCALAPYFPAERNREFLNAHRLFGVSNILKIIKNLDPQCRADAMSTIIYQSNMRAHDPVGGCYRVILELQRQYEYLSAELAAVMHQLALCRGQQNVVVVDDAVYTNDVMARQLQHAQQQQQQQCYDYFSFDGNNVENENDMNDIHVQSGYNDNAALSCNSVNNNDNYNVNEVDIESMLSLQQQQQQHDDDVKPLIDVFDITNALGMNGDEEDEMGEITSKAADLDLASGSNYLCGETIQTIKEEANPMENVIQEHDLKGAASLFTLTSQDSSYV